jgi:hypothetical protein
LRIQLLHGINNFLCVFPWRSRSSSSRAEEVEAQLHTIRTSACRAREARSGFGFGNYDPAEAVVESRDRRGGGGQTRAE